MGAGEWYGNFLSLSCSTFGTMRWDEMRTWPSGHWVILTLFSFMTLSAKPSQQPHSQVQILENSRELNNLSLPPFLSGIPPQENMLLKNSSNNYFSNPGCLNRSTKNGGFQYIINTDIRSSIHPTQIIFHSSPYGFRGQAWGLPTGLLWSPGTAESKLFLLLGSSELPRHKGLWHCFASFLHFALSSYLFSLLVSLWKAPDSLGRIETICITIHCIRSPGVCTEKPALDQAPRLHRLERHSAVFAMPEEYVWENTAFSV